MRNKIIILISLVLFLLPTFGSRVEGISMNKPVAKPEIKAQRLDPQAQILSAYLAKYNSPLQYHAQDFIDAANQYNLDWKLVAAISGVESTFGKHIPGGYNGWGWGVYGTQALRFNSWRDGIFTVSKGLRERYVNRGLTEPYSMNRVYAASPRWGGNVTFFMNDLEKFAQIYDTKDIAKAGITPKIAAISGQLVLK